MSTPRFNAVLYSALHCCETAAVGGGVASGLGFRDFDAARVEDQEDALGAALGTQTLGGVPDSGLAYADRSPAPLS